LREVLKVSAGLIVAEAYLLATVTALGGGWWHQHYASTA
jgi:hypothetical protein